MEKKQHIDLNNINNHILLFGGNNDNTDKYGISTGEDKIFNNVGNSDDINLSSGLYIYYDPIYNPQKITFFMYDEKAVGKIENKIVYQLPNDTKISDKNDILKVIIDNVDKVFPEPNNDNNQQIIKEKFFQLFIPCLNSGYKIEQTYLNSDTGKESFINAQLNEVKKKIAVLYPDELKNTEMLKKTNMNKKNKDKYNSIKNKQEPESINNPNQIKLKVFLEQCKNFIQNSHNKQLKNNAQLIRNIDNKDASIDIDYGKTRQGCLCIF